mgnify:CR=1 FL=1
MEILPMNNVLSGIERDLIVSYLCDCNVPFTLVPSQPGAKIFSFTTGQDGVRILPEGIILFTNPRFLPQDLIGQQVSLRFYFKKLGLSFSSLVSCTKAGAIALVVPREILRLPDVEGSSGRGFSCNIFLGEAFGGECLACSLHDSYPLFMPWVWRLLPAQEEERLAGYLRRLCGAVPVEVPALIRSKLVQSGKALLVNAGWIQPGMALPFDGCISSRDVVGELELLDGLSQLKSGFYFTGGHAGAADKTIGSTHQVYCIEGIAAPEKLAEILALIPACRYLSDSQQGNPPPALLDRMASLELLYLSSTEIVVASQGGRFPLQRSARYSLLLQIPVHSLRRSITVDCTVASLYEGVEGRICALCRLENLKAEDQRFLFESLNDSRYR